jgi:hypothetical protein
MFAPLEDLLGGLVVKCSLRSPTGDIESDNIELFIKSEWPLKISSIHIEAHGSDQDIEILLDIKNARKDTGSVTVSGGDPIWVEGMSTAIENIFAKSRTWYSDIRKHWQIRLVMSLALVSLVAWELNHSISKLATPIIGMTETQFFLVVLLLLMWLLYPLDKVLLWLFPMFECENSTQKRVRTAFWFFFIVLVGWVITDLLLPHALL